MVAEYIIKPWFFIGFYLNYYHLCVIEKQRRSVESLTLVWRNGAEIRIFIGRDINLKKGANAQEPSGSDMNN